MEIHNNSATVVNLGGKSIQYGSSTGNFGSSSALVFALPSTDLAPGAYFLLQAGSSTTGACTALPSPDGTASGMNMSATAGKLALVNQTAALNCGAVATPCAGTIPFIDRVGYGTGTTSAETAPAPGPTDQTSVTRITGCVDTNGNSVDFAVAAPSFRTACTGVIATSTPTANAGTPGTPTATPTPTATSTPVRIHDIQGAAQRSPLVGRAVSNVFGIVTMKRQTGTSGGNPVYGFYIQETPDNYDADDRTSEAVFVATAPTRSVGSALAMPCP